MIKTLIKGILAGIAISLGGWLCLKSNVVMNNNFVGSFIFSAGLILIVNFDFYLYTGKVCYLYESKDKRNWLHLLVGITGNLIGCILMGLLMFTAFSNTAKEVFTLVENMIKSKLSSVWYINAIKSFFCGMLVYLAVDGFKKIENNFGKYVVLVICIGGFVFAGFEHCVANMFYFALGLSFTLDTLVALLLCILFNSLGGLFIPTLNLLMKKNKE